MIKNVSKFPCFRPARARLSIGIPRTYVCTCAQFGVLLRNTPHNTGVSALTRPVGLSFDQPNRLILIGCFVPKHPDTLNPNGISIIHLLGLLTEPAASCGTGALQGRLCHKSFFAVQPWGEPEGYALLPPRPPLCINSKAIEAMGTRGVNCRRQEGRPRGPLYILNEYQIHTHTYSK